MTGLKKRPGKAPFGNLPGRFILVFRERSDPLGTYLMYSTASVAAI